LQVCLECARMITATPRRACAVGTLREAQGLSAVSGRYSSSFADIPVHAYDWGLSHSHLSSHPCHLPSLISCRPLLVIRKLTFAFNRQSIPASPTSQVSEPPPSYPVHCSLSVWGPMACIIEPFRNSRDSQVLKSTRPFTSSPSQNQILSGQSVPASSLPGTATSIPFRAVVCSMAMSRGS
jgi:hypothetical protein